MPQRFRRPRPASPVWIRDVYPSRGGCWLIVLLTADFIRCLRFSNSLFCVPGIDFICTDIYTFLNPECPQNSQDNTGQKKKMPLISTVRAPEWMFLFSVLLRPRKSRLPVKSPTEARVQNASPALHPTASKLGRAVRGSLRIIW